MGIHTVKQGANCRIVCFVSGQGDGLYIISKRTETEFGIRGLGPTETKLEVEVGSDRRAAQGETRVTRVETRETRETRDRDDKDEAGEG